MADKNERIYPPVGFHFSVSFSGIGDADIDGRFQSVAGLSMEMETESRVEGGETRFEHVLPLRTKYATLVLKRGLVTNSALLKDWCGKAFNSSTLTIEPKDLTVTLLNENRDPLITWNVYQAWPKKWSVSDLNAEQSAFAIETFELQYKYFTLK